MPFHCDDVRTDGWAQETLDELDTISQQQEQEQQQDKRPLVEWMRAVLLQQNNAGPTTEDFIAEDYEMGTGGKSPLPSWTKDTRLEFQHVTTEMLWYQNSIFRLRIPSQERLLANGYKHAWFFKTPIVNAPKVLQEMLDEVQAHPLAQVDVDTGRYYTSLEEMVQDAQDLGCNRVLNATGLGSAEICQDEQLLGARGILLHYDRQECPRIVEQEDVSLEHDAVICCEDGPWGSDSLPSYLIPRGDVIVAGGSYLEGDAETSIRPEERKRLLENARTLGIDTEQVDPIGQWTGFRPYRAQSRLEVDDMYSKGDMRLVHSYGYGGSGWTVYVGCAKDATQLLLED